MDEIEVLCAICFYCFTCNVLCVEEPKPISSEPPQVINPINNS